MFSITIALTVKMSSVITSLLGSTFGLLLTKARDYTAAKLKEGDLTDEQCRKFIVRELDDIKSKLDGLARKDLETSVNFLKEGVCFLNMSLGKPSHDETRQDISQAEAVINEALPLALLHEIQKLNISSETRFQSAKAKFEKSNTEATRAFSNKMLSTEDRILATKLRMISTILENLEDPDAAASACQLYLQDLHAMPAVQEIFSVHASGGMKSRFNKTERLESVKSVTMINYVLFHFIDKFTKRERPNVYNWPRIETGKKSYYPLLYEGSEILANMGVDLPCHTLTCDVKAAGRISTAVVNSDAEIIIASKVSGNVNVINNQGETKLFCSLPQEETEARSFFIHSLAIDDEDNVYIVTCLEQTDRVCSFKLFVIDAEGNLKHQSPLQFLSGKDDRLQISIDMAKNIIIHKRGERRVYVCDKDGQLQYSFPLEMNIDIYAVYLSYFSDKNEIVAAPWFANTVYMYTEGKLKQTIKLPKDHEVLGVAVHHITKKIIVHTEVRDRRTCYLLSYSQTDELQTLPLFHDSDYLHDKLTSHPNGTVALVQKKGVIFL